MRRKSHFLFMLQSTWHGFLRWSHYSICVPYLYFVWDSRCDIYLGDCRLCVSLSLTAFPHYCTDQDLSWGNCRRCPVVVHCWARLQSLRGFRCYVNIAPNAKCQRVLVIALTLLVLTFQRFNACITQRLHACKYYILLESGVCIIRCIIIFMLVCIPF